MLAFKNSNTRAAEKPSVKDNRSGRDLTVTVRLGNIRAAPDVSARVLYKLISGAKVSLLATNGNWYQVRLKNGLVAWAHRSIFE